MLQKRENAIIALLINGDKNVYEQIKHRILPSDLKLEVNKKIVEKVYSEYEKTGMPANNIMDLFTEDQEKNERYIEVKFIVKKPDYEPDEDIDNFKVEIQNRAVKKVRADINKLNKKDKLLAEQEADLKVQQYVEKYM